MVGTKPNRWAEIRERTLADPVMGERYERTRRSVLATRRLLQLIDAERERAGLTKAELAERVGATPSAVRRLLTSEGSNPTLRTLLGLFDALDLEFSVGPKKRARKSRAARTSPQQMPRGVPE